MPLGTAQQTITTGANFIPELWGPEVILAATNNLVFRPLCWDWSDPVKGKGDTIHVPNISNFVTTAKAANTQVTLQAPTEAMVNLLVNQHDESSFLIEDMLKVQSTFNLMQFYTQKAGFACAQTMDTQANNLVSGFSQILGSAGIDLGDVQIRDGIEFLDLANAPPTDRAIVIHPTQKNALFGIEKYFRADFRGDGSSDILVKGRFGTIYGLPVYVSTNVGTSGNAYLNTVMQREAIAIADQLGPRTQGDYFLEYLGNLVVSDVIHGSIESRDSFGVWLRS